MNNGISEKDIRIKSMVQHKAPIWINSFATDSIDENWEYPNAEALKQQILNNHLIVNRIIERIAEIETQIEVIRSYPDGEINKSLRIHDARYEQDILQRIIELKTTVHSGGNS